ncbi:SPRY-domain-containing protein [Coprinellus micaceus]|uniref:SPRY-domain-containing protein n=1 Tax=Coprinellus micaceus TaxID=71717 RepID=A0A4Y7TY85_COPMI|nr:SPRY-domain-containing protein [Coprinellus micaceus]
MASRPGRASSIPIPMPPSHARSIDNAISIPSSRTRLSSASFAASPPSLGGRSVPRASSSLSRVAARQPYEPRIVRATATTSSEYCPPSLSPGHARRASTSASYGRTLRVSLSSHPEAPPVVLSTEIFPRPAYLDSSIFRDALHTEPPSALPRKDAAASPPVRSHASTPSTESDEESGTPPRRTQSSSSATPSASSLSLPTKWSTQMKSPHLGLSADGRELTYSLGNGDKEGASARTDVPIPPACGIYYYEVEIRGKDSRSHIGIGFGGPVTRLNRLPGWEPASWGYHGDDGRSFYAHKEGTPYSQTFGSSDTVGCGIDFSTRRAFYTKNGHLLGNVFENVGKDTELYPFVGLQHVGDIVRVNFGQEPFKFDIETHVQQQKILAWNRFMTTPLYASILNPGSSGPSFGPKRALSEEESKVVLNKLVLSYLVHHGYSKTVRAFQKHQGGVVKSKSDTGLEEDFEMESASPVKETPMEDSLGDDIEKRTRIVSAVAKGDIDLALIETEEFHPTVLKAEASLMLFKLRTAAMKKARERGESGLELSASTSSTAGSSTTASTAADGDWFEENMDMDVDDDDDGTAQRPLSKIDPGSVRAGKQRAEEDIDAAHDAALRAAIAYGQSLKTDYEADTRPEVKQLFNKTFGILAYTDPLTAGGEVSAFVSAEARAQLANELNTRILKSQGRPAEPALETLYRHTSACITQLGMLGEGAAAFADLQRELLEA